MTEAELARAAGRHAGRYAEVRGKLVDVENLRRRNDLLVDLAQRRRSGLAALLALRDELHENFASVQLPVEVGAHAGTAARLCKASQRSNRRRLPDGELRGYQKRGLDFLTYLSEFGFGGILADEMGLGKTLAGD